MLGIVLALGSSVAWGIADFLGGQQTRRSGALTVLLLTQPIGLALALIVALAIGADPLSQGATMSAVAAGVVIVAALAAFYSAMALGSVSVVATIAALGVMVPVVGGLAQGEDPAAIQLAGAAVAVVGVILVAREPDPEWRSATRGAIGLAALAALGIGVFFLLLDDAASESPAWAVVLARVGGISALLLAALWARPRLAVPRDVVGVMVTIGVCEIGANMLFAVATNHGLLSLVSVAGSLYSAVTVLLAWVILGERLRGPQRIGVVLALGGVAAIAGGS
jgi:drug/metabolite transporter (DMT)-like permease